MTTDDADDAMLYIGADIAPDLEPLVYRMVDRPPLAPEPVAPFGLGSVRSAARLQAAEQQARAAFNEADAALRRDLTSLADMLPRSMSELIEIDGDAGRGFDSLADGGT